MVVVLFDVDGTLVDSTEPILMGMNDALGANGLPLMSEGDLRNIVGPPIHQALYSVMRSWGENVDLVPKLVSDFRRVYQPLSIDLAATYPGVPELLSEVSRTARLGVVTSKPAAYAGPILERLDFAEYFEVIEGPDVGAEMEPKATTLRRGLTGMDVDLSDEPIIMVGDRSQDVDAGRACNTQTVGVTWGFGCRNELVSAGADSVIDNPDQLLRLIPDRP